MQYKKVDNLKSFCSKEDKESHCEYQVVAQHTNNVCEPAHTGPQRGWVTVNSGIHAACALKGAPPHSTAALSIIAVPGWAWQLHSHPYSQVGERQPAGGMLMMW